MKDSIIFDLDGTLWDSTGVTADAWNKAIKEHSALEPVITSDLLKTQFGQPLPQIARNIFPDFSEQEQQNLISLCCEEEHRYIETYSAPLFAGVEETLDLLSKKYKLFIVSNCQSGYIELFLEKTGFGTFFTDFECPGETGLSKGENITLIIERNQLKDPVYVGDTSGDEKACRAAGIPFTFASYGFGTAEAPDYVIKEFKELLYLYE